MDLQGTDISSNKISNVIKSVGNNIFHTSVDLPCRSTILNISDEGHMVAKQQVGETLATPENFDLFSDGTARDGKKILDLGVHTKTATFSLGYKVIAKEDSETVSGVIKDTLIESASFQNENLNKLLLSLSAMMSDRSSVMKKTNQIIDEWRSTELRKQLNENDIEKLKKILLFCSCTFRFP